MFTTESPITIPEALPGSQQAYMATPFKSSVFERLDAAIAAIEKGGKAATLSQQFTDALIVVADAAFEVYFMTPMREVKLNRAVRKSAEAGMAGAVKGVHLLIRQMFKKMSVEELQTFAAYMKTLMLEPDETGLRYLGFPLKQPLYEETREIIARIQVDENTDSYSGWIVEVLTRIFDNAVECYYTIPADMANMGRIKRKTADIGISAAVKAARAVIRQLFKKTRQKEMLKFAGFLQDVIVIQ